jgi:hypothetical protein
LCLAACSVTPSAGNPNTALNSDTHRFFPITAGPHAVDCAVCHGGASTFKDFTCFNCHGHEQQPLMD